MTYCTKAPALSYRIANYTASKCVDTL